MSETYEQQMKDSEMIFKQITCGDFDSWNEAEAAVVALYVADPTISRAGISHALSRLERHYKSAATSETEGEK